MNEKTVARFWRKVDRENGPVLVPELGPCWIWFGSRHLHGYGEMRIAGKINRAHRMSWEFENGEIGDRLVCHACDNPSCVRPSHLWLGTNAQNTADSVSKKRRANGKKNGAYTRPDRVRKGESHGRSKLNADSVRAIRASSARTSDLAKLHGVSEAAIYYVRKGVHWRDV